MNDFRSSKPAIASTTIVANTGGLVAQAIALWELFGSTVPEPTVIAITSAVGLLANIFGIFGRKKAKKKIKGILFGKRR